MSFKLINGSFFEIATTLEGVKLSSSVTNAVEAVVTCNNHGYSSGDVIVVSDGWSKMKNKSFIVDRLTTNTFKVRGFDTRSNIHFPQSNPTLTFYKVSNWKRIPNILSVEASSGEQNFHTWQNFRSHNESTHPTYKANGSINMTIADNSQEVLSDIARLEEDGSLTALKLIMSGGENITYCGYIGISDSPNLQMNQINQRRLMFALTNTPSRYK